MTDTRPDFGDELHQAARALADGKQGMTLEAGFDLVQSILGDQRIVSIPDPVQGGPVPAGAVEKIAEIAREAGISPERALAAAQHLGRAFEVQETAPPRAFDAEPKIAVESLPDGGTRVRLSGDVMTTEPRAVLEMLGEKRAEQMARENAQDGTFPEHYRKLGDCGLMARRKHRCGGDMDLVQRLFGELLKGAAGPIRPEMCFELAMDIGLADHWREAGRPRLVLTDSLAALLSLTRSPPLLWDFLPYRAFMIEVPRRYLPLAGPEHMPAWIILGKVGTTGVLVDGCNPFVVTSRAYQQQGVTEDLAERSTDPAMARLAIRLAANVCAFVAQHRECVRARPSGRPKPGQPPPDQVMDLRPPPELAVTRVLRDHAAALVSARSLDGARRVLRHVVRGHWKHQPCGPGRTERKLIFVAPYLKGDESLGRVADKILRLEEG